MKMKEFQAPKSACPYCGYAMDRCSLPPDSNVITVCTNCSGLLKFDDDLMLQKLQISELLQFSQQQPKDYDNLMRLQQAIREVKDRS